MKNIAIITACGDSKRIPKKNIKDFCGKPIMAYSIEEALNSGLFDEVMVSTDDKALVLPNTIPYFRKETEVQDIDNIEDWQLAELKYKQMISL